MDRKRLDIILYERSLVKSRKIATDLIKHGKVTVDGEKITKASKTFDDDIKVNITDMPKFVSRAGLKLEAILEKFGINVANKTVLDVGSSTGGFTDCVLQGGAKRVYAVDVGHDQLSETLKNDKRVVSIERTDIRSLRKLPEEIDLAVIDVSFISLEKVLPSVLDFLKSHGEVIALIKPQFEVGKENLNKKGIVKTVEARNIAIEKIKKFTQTIGLKIFGEMESPISGGDGNVEYLLYLKR